MLNCKEVTRIIASSERSHWRRQLEIRMHLLMCKHCRKFSNQLDAIKSAAKKFFGIDDINSADDPKIKDLENRIIQKLRK